MNIIINKILLPGDAWNASKTDGCTSKTKKKLKYLKKQEIQDTFIKTS